MSYHHRTVLLFPAPAKRSHLSSRTKITGKVNRSKDNHEHSTLLLNEYKALIVVLSKLTVPSFQKIYLEVDAAADQLLKWFSESKSSNTLSLYLLLRQLKTKAKQLCCDQQAANTTTRRLFKSTGNESSTIKFL